MHWLYRDRERWLLWVPVALGIGIGLFLSLPYSLSIISTIAILVLSAAACLLTYHRFYFLYPTMLILLFISCGYTLINSQTYIRAKSPIIAEDLGTIWIRANVEKIEQRTTGKRIFLTELDLWKPERGSFGKQDTPYRARLNIRTEMDPNISPGDKVSLKAILSPPPKRATYPNAYDFSFFAFYKQIGAVGYSISPVKLYKDNKASGIITSIEEARHNIINKILNSTPEGSRNIATALLAGEKGAIDKKVVQSIRNTGLGHLLAISGLHMALVMAGIFTILRMILACNEKISLNYNTKKWASLMAMVAGLVYLCVSGFPVSAKRAYIMVGLVFLAIILDRKASPMRLLAIAAIVVLSIAPESLLTASFQMSFAAVTALIAFFERPTATSGNIDASPSVFERITGTFKPDEFSGSFFFKLKKYFIGTLFSSIIAGLATMPFAIYHFGHFSAYSVIANMVAIPLTAFWIMPWGILSLFLMPIGLEAIALYPMHLGIQILIHIAQIVQSWPNGNVLVAHIDSIYIALVAICGLWLCIWQQAKIRLLCLIPLIICSILYFTLSHKNPDLIINGNGKLYAFIGADNQLYFSSLQKARYARSQWLQMLGKEKGYHLRDLPKQSPETAFMCDNYHCSYNKNGKNIDIITLEGASPSQESCNQAAIVINLLGNERCKETKTITISDLNKYGTHAIYLSSPLSIETVESD